MLNLNSECIASTVEISLRDENDIVNISFLSIPFEESLTSEFIKNPKNYSFSIKLSRKNNLPSFYLTIKKEEDQYPVFYSHLKFQENLDKWKRWKEWYKKNNLWLLILKSDKIYYLIIEKNGQLKKIFISEKRKEG